MIEKLKQYNNILEVRLFNWCPSLSTFWSAPLVLMLRLFRISYAPFYPIIFSSSMLISNTFWFRNLKGLQRSNLLFKQWYSMDKLQICRPNTALSLNMSCVHVWCRKWDSFVFTLAWLCTLWDRFFGGIDCLGWLVRTVACTQDLEKFLFICLKGCEHEKEGKYFGNVRFLLWFGTFGWLLSSEVFLSLDALWDIIIFAASLWCSVHGFFKAFALLDMQRDRAALLHDQVSLFYSYIFMLWLNFFS